MGKLPDFAHIIAAFRLGLQTQLLIHPLYTVGRPEGTPPEIVAEEVRMGQYTGGVRPARSDTSQSAPNSQAHNADITVGYEMEVLVAMLNKPEDPHPDDTRWCLPFVERRSGTHMPESTMAKGKMVEIIREAGLPAIKDWSEATSNPHCLPHAILVSQYHQVVNDSSVHADQWDMRQGSYDWVGAELVSRVLRYPEESGTQASKICRGLRDRMRLHVNRTTGFHVHVGVNNLSLTQIKKFFTLYWAVEDVLFSLCAPHRRQSIYCDPVREYSDAVFRARDETNMIEPEEMTFWFPEFVPDDIRNELVPIWRATERFELSLRLLKPPTMCIMSDRNAIALREHDPMMLDVGELCDYTVEFRHLQGTVNPSLIKNWTDVIVALVRGAMKPRDDFKRLFQDLLHCATLPAAAACNSMLTDLDLEAAMPFWAQQREGNMVEAGQRAGGLVPRNPLLPPIGTDDIDCHDFTGWDDMERIEKTGSVFEIRI